MGYCVANIDPLILDSCNRPWSRARWVSCSAIWWVIEVTGNSSQCFGFSDRHPDLPGRGYSSTPSPTVHSQTSEFFIATILFVLASSSLSWTGPNSFSILGYSLGGGIAVNFASCFPSLISSVILLAPSGFIRSYHFGWQSKFLYSSSLLPDWAVEQLVNWKLSNNSRPDRGQSGTAFEDELPLTEQCGDELACGPKFDIPMALVRQFSCSNHATCSAVRPSRKSLKCRSAALLSPVGLT